MPRPQSKSSRTSLYRLVGLGSLRQAIRQKYLTSDLFEATDTFVENRTALLVSGEMRTDNAKWAGRLSVLSGKHVAVGNTTAAAVLIIEDGPEEAWALTYGMGFQMLSRDHQDPGFGLGVAIRAASPESISSMTRTMLDHRSRTDRSSIPGGEALRSFGFTDLGEVVSRIAAEAEVEGLIDDRAKIAIRGADALSIPLAKQPADLLRDLDAIAAILEKEPRPGLGSLEQLRRVRGSRAADLDDHLHRALQDRDLDSLSIGWPHERIDENGTPSSFVVRGSGRRTPEPFDGLPRLELILEAIHERSEDPLSAAKSVKLQLFRDADGEEPISPEIPARNWLFYEVEIDGVRYCYFDAKWYAMDGDYASDVAARVREVFARSSPVDLPDWPLATCSDEAAYNLYAAQQLPSAVSLDRMLIRTTQHPRGFEVADLVTESGDLIHVKHVERSSTASHLVAQAIVSTDAVRLDSQARRAVRREIAAAGGDGSWLGRRPRSVVLGLARDQPIQPASLFTFTQVTLARLDSLLGDAGIELSVCPIRRFA